MSIENTGLTVEQIVDFCNGNLKEKTLDELFDMMSKVSAYALYIKNLKGTTLAFLNIKQEELDRKLYLMTQKVEGQYLTKEEKKAQVIASNEGIRKLSNKCLELKAKYNKVRDICYAVDNIMGNMKLYYRKANG